MPRVVVTATRAAIQGIAERAAAERAAVGLAAAGRASAVRAAAGRTVAKHAADCGSSSVLLLDIDVNIKAKQSRVVQRVLPLFVCAL